MQAVMLAHQRTLLTLLGSCVAGQRDLAALAPTLVATGRMHVRFGATIRDLLAPCGAALADTLAAALGESFTPDVEAAWRRVFAFVAAHMLQGIDAASAAGAAEHALKSKLLGMNAESSGVVAAGSPC
jgi:hemoglobin-like flavoprotein